MQLRAPLIVIESVPEGTVSLRVPLVVTEPLTEHSGTQLRQSLLVLEPLEESFRTLRCSLFVIETLHPVTPEGHVSTELYPGSTGSSVSLPGLKIQSIHKRPTYSTSVYKGVSRVSVRRANMQYPIWEYELIYEFLRDNVNSEFQSLMDFFLARQGAFDTFLFKDTNDYQVINGFQATADGVTTQFSFKRSFGTAFYEKIGQVDTGNTINIYGTVAENDNIPGTGPYTITVTNSSSWVADVGVTKGGVAMTEVASSPAAGQYSVAAGVYTFNSADHGAAVVITYRYTISPSAYTVTLPNLFVFTSAPANGLILSADFQFFFNLRFQDDVADFNKFANTFWELQKIVLESVPQ